MYGCFSPADLSEATLWGWLLGLPTWGLFVFGMFVLPAANSHHHAFGIHVPFRRFLRPLFKRLRRDNEDPTARFKKPHDIAT